MTYLLYMMFSVIDMIVYGLASAMFGIIRAIATTSYFDINQINEVASRIYIIVGVLMLFKIVISAVQYMINPDTFDDKDKGVAGLLKKTVISLGLIVVAPTIFNFMIEIQEPIIKTLPKIILGADATDSTEDENNIALTVLKSFVRVRKDDGKGNEIHSITDLPAHVVDNCPKLSLIFAGNMDSCKYDYMIVVSTLCGGFLCYVLLSMILDIAIRTIKFSIIRMLAPIPISSYIVSKDKLSKFVKTTTTVYLDLFIRMIIVYFIIFAIKSLIEAGTLNVLDIGGGGVADTGSWFKNVIVNIALIFGLLMFAKNAPKFISELLGLPDIGSGEMADMFKPAWQRAGGAAGALINPARNATSNWRKAMENNGDMGGKHRRRINALRHAVGGFGKGALDAAQGVMAGDDWAKMGGRHDASVKKSSMHSAAAFMRRTSGAEVKGENDQIKQRRKEIEDFYRQQGIDISNLRNSYLSTARANHANRVTDLNNQINTLKNDLAQGGLGSDERNKKLTELNSLQNELNSISTNSGMNKWIKDEQNRLAAEELANREIATITTRKAAVDNRLATAQANLAAAVTDADKRKYQQEAIELANEQSKLEDALSTDGKARINATMKEYVETGTLATKPADISRTTIVRGKIDQFFGGEGFTGKGYIDVSDLLKNNRSNLYTGEAMTKMRQNADILVDVNGNELQFTTKFNNDTSKQFSYVDMAAIKKKVDTGQIIESDLKANYGFENAAMFQSAFEDIEKKAAEAYVSANMAQIDSEVAKNTTARLKRPEEVNSTITLGIERLKASLAAANIPKEEKDQLLKELAENPGKFFKGASDRQEQLRTKGSRISAYNSGQKNSNG